MLQVDKGEDEGMGCGKEKEMATVAVLRTKLVARQDSA